MYSKKKVFLISRCNILCVSDVCLDYLCIYSILSAAESIQILAVVGEAKPHTEQSGWPSHIVRLKVMYSKKKKEKEIYYF